MKGVKKIEFLVVLLFFAFPLYSQEPGLQYSSSATSLVSVQPGDFEGSGISLLRFHDVRSSFNTNIPFQFKSFFLPPLPAASVNERSLFLPDPSPTAFFCRMELKLEDHTKVPIRFRLGSLEYTNRLEGKD